MQEQDGLNSAEREMESALAGLVPSAARIDPISAAYTAGRRSARRSVRLWQSAAVVMLLAGAGSWLTPGGRNAPVGPRQALEPAVALRAQAASEPPAAQSMQVLQQTIRREGLDGLPDANIPAVQIMHVGDIF